MQIYSFDDPTANTYGNLDFSDLFSFALYMTNQTVPPVVPSPSPSPAPAAAVKAGAGSVSMSGVGASPDGRDVVWHGETGYWVNYDIDASLALGALYGDRRLSDLRRLASQASEGSRGAVDG